MKKLIPTLFLCVTSLIGCPKVAQTAYSLIVGAKAFTDKVASQHPECATGASSTVCVDLKKAIAAKDALIDATEVYCSGPDFNAGGACDEPNANTPAGAAATAKLQAAIQSYNQASTDLKGVIQ